MGLQAPRGGSGGGGGGSVGGLAPGHPLQLLPCHLRLLTLHLQLHLELLQLGGGVGLGEVGAAHRRQLGEELWREGEGDVSMKCFQLGLSC